MTPLETSRRLKERAAFHGFDRAAVTAALPVEEDAAFLESWCRDGHSAAMGWLGRDPVRRGRPSSFLSSARTLLSLGVSYFTGAVPPRPEAPAGRVARYAWGRDYHEVITRRLELFRRDLVDAFGPTLEVRDALDVQPLLERAFARRAGLGFVGKNTNVIAPRMGSFLFLAELVLNVEAAPDAPVAAGCGGCVTCAERCPTNALATPHTLDARLCLAYHTIENRGSIPPSFRPALGDWLFGCDDCQDPCPFNARPLASRWPELGSNASAGAWLDLAEILALRSEDDFRRRFAGTALLRAKRAGLVRNACVVAANQRAGGLRPLLTECLEHDPSPVVRAHAAWALGRWGAGERRVLERALAREIDAEVRREMSTLLDGSDSVAR
jgi:epoxyqueuosine reductase